MMLNRQSLAYGLFFMCLLHVSAHAQRIQKVDVLGLKRIGVEAITSVMVNQVGKTLDRIKVSDDIKKIYSLGYFDDVKVFFEPEGQALLVELSEKKFISSIRFEGNDKEDDKTLKEQISLKPFQFFDKDATREAADLLKSYYSNKGYYLADIQSKIEEKDGKHDLVFFVEENSKVKIERILFLGNEVLSDEDLRSVMLTKKRTVLSFLSGSGNYREEMLAQDQIILRERYGKDGYLDAKISKPVVLISPDKKEITVSITVDEGKKYEVGQVEVSGDLLKAKSEVEEKISLKSGEVANTLKIQQDIRSLAQIYSNEGYAYVNVIPQDRRDKETQKIDVNYFIQPGQKVRVERILFRGHNSTRDKVLRREMEIVEGDLYNASKIQQSRANIERLSLYEEVRITTPRASSDDTVDIVIEVKEKQTGTFNIGAGFNTLDSFQVMGNIEKRNLFGYGVDITLNARLGGRSQSFNLQFRDEHFMDTKWGMTINAFNTDRRFSSFDLRSRGGSLGFDYPLYRKGLKRMRMGVTYSFIDQDLSNLRPTVENLFSSGITSSIRGVLNWDTRNRVFEPTKGMFLRLSEEIAGSVLGGDNSFSKLEFDGRWFYPLLAKTKIPVLKDGVLGFNLKLGYVAPLDGNDRVPLFERYFPGGILSLRGFPIRSLGPKIQIASSSDPSSLSVSDFVVGGNKQLIFNAEYLFPIIKPANIKGVLFFDMGNAFDNGENLWTLKGQRQSVGFGVRWFSPIGPLRFEWGYPLDRKEDEDKVVFDFTIGSLF